MANQKPMTVLSLECLLGFMEPHQRILLVARCPSLRGAHQSAPLTVKHLKLDDNCLVLDNYKYEFNTKSIKPGAETKRFDNREYESAFYGLRFEAPSWKEEEGSGRPNRLKTVPARYRDGIVECPAFTVPRTSPQKAAQASDARFRKNPKVQCSRPPPGLELKKNDLKRSATARVQYSPPPQQGIQLVPQDIESPCTLYPQTLNIAPPNKKRRTDSEEWTSAGTEQQDPVYNGPEGISVDFKLSHVSEDRAIHAKNFENVSIQDLMSILLKNVLSRKMHVQNLEIDGLPILPVTVKFRIHNLNSTSLGFEAIHTRVLENGSTFENATLTFAPRHLDLTESPILHRFQQLNLVMEPGQFNFARAIQQLQNMKINVSNYTTHVGDIARIAKNWVEVNKSLGAKLTVKLGGTFIHSWIDMIMRRLSDLIGSNWKMIGSQRCATLRIGGNNELVVYLGNFGGTLMWVLEVMKVGRARAVE